MLINLFRLGLPFGIFLAVLLSYLIVLMFSFSIHEFSHAFAAYRNGDPTAKSLGRMTINPFAHFNLYGFFCLIVFSFGWAEPVPVNPFNYTRGKKSMFSVAIAGIASNLILAIIFSFIYSLLGTVVPNFLAGDEFFSVFVYYLLNFGITINLTLAVFNFLPFYPLDGFNVLELILKPGNKFLEFMRKYSIIIMLGLILLGLLSALIGIIVEFLGLGMITLWTSLFNLFM